MTKAKLVLVALAVTALAPTFVFSSGSYPMAGTLVADETGLGFGLEYNCDPLNVGNSDAVTKIKCKFTQLSLYPETEDNEESKAKLAAGVDEVKSLSDSELATFFQNCKKRGRLRQSTFCNSARVHAPNGSCPVQ